MDNFEEVTPPGWSLPRVAALFVMGIVAGALIGGIVAAVLVLASRPDLSESTEPSLAFFAILVGGAVGSVLATVAGLGAIVGLLVFDHWGESSPTRRSWFAGIGAAATTLFVGLLATLSGAAEIGVVAAAAAVVGAGVFAGAGLRVFERRFS